MSFPPASSQQSLEEELCQCWAEVSTRQNLTISCARGAAMEPATMYSPPGNGASPGSHRQRNKSVSPRESIEKMGPRHGAIIKPHRQQRQTSKGPIKIYPADTSNFKELVHEHTSMRPLALTVDITALTSPRTPHGASHSSTRGITSQPSSPATPHSIQSSTASPLTSPQSPYLINGFSQLPPLEQAELSSSLFNTHLSNLYTNPHQDSALALSHNTNLPYQSNAVPQCAVKPCLGTSSEAGNVPSDDGRPYSMNPKPYASQSSLERLLNGSPRSYDKQLSFERLMKEDFMQRVLPGVETLANSVL